MALGPHLSRGALLLVLVAAGLAGAQPAEVPDVPPGPGSVRGRVVGPAAGVAGAPVVLYALSASGGAGLRSSTTGPDGAFVFEGVSNDPDTVYLVGTRYRDVPFGARVRFAAGQTEVSVAIEVAESTADASGVQRGGARLRVDRGCGALRISETWELRNAGDLVVQVPDAERAERDPLFETRLPEAASGFSAPFGGLQEGLEQQGGRVRFWGPLYPGSQELGFSYSLPAEAGDLALETGAERVRLLVPPQGVEPRGAALEETGETTLDGRRYRVFEAGPGVSLALAPVAAADARVRVERTIMWLELDDAALGVDEQHQLVVEGDAALESGNGEPLLCLALPEDARDLRFAPAALELGLEPDASGALAVRGPLPPGESSIALRYRLPVSGERVRLERRIASDVDVLSVFVADTGVRAQTSRLHRLRPVRSDDRNFIHLEGFQLAAGERLELELERLPARRAASPWVRSALVFGLAALAAALLVAPLRGPGRDAGEITSQAQRAAEEREVLYAAIRDLDDDLDTGKLTPADHAALRADLRAQAVASVAREREAQVKPRGCPACGAEPPSGARFCPQCGVALEALQGRGDSAA